MSDIVQRLRAPAYWMSGSSEGHEGENNAPVEAADEIERLRAALRDVDQLMKDGNASLAWAKARAALEENGE